MLTEFYRSRLPQEGRIVWPGITIGVACSLLSRHITVNGRRSSDQDYYSHAMVESYTNGA